jgi:mRNA interferase HigB
VSILKDGRAVFNIAGNNFRLVVHIAYKFQTVLVKFIGTHGEYDQIDAQTVDQKKWR